MDKEVSYLLTKEETEKVWTEALDKNPHWEVDAIGLFDVVAKAQLKKVVNALYPCMSGNEYSLFRDCRTQELSLREEDWNQLVKEVEDE